MTMSMTVSIQCFALCVSSRGLPLHLRVVASPTLAIGKSKVAKGKVAKSAKEDMAVKGKVHKSKAKAVHAKVHAMHKVMKNSWHACGKG